MTKDFALVTFPNDGNSEEEIVSEVPSLWLRSNLTQCWWPSVKNINTFIVKQIPPVTDDPKWSLYPIRFHGYYGNKLIFYLRVYIVVFKCLTNNVICKLWFCLNQDSLDQARQKATNYSSSNDSDINEVKKNPRNPYKKQLQKNMVSDSESDSDATSVIPSPPNLTNNNISVNKPSNIPNLAENVIRDMNLDVIEGAIVPHKSNVLF